jgi:hypothetical protein
MPSGRKSVIFYQQDPSHAYLVNTPLLAPNTREVQRAKSEKPTPVGVREKQKAWC